MHVLIMPMTPGDIVETLGTFKFAPEGKNFEAVLPLDINHGREFVRNRTHCMLEIWVMAHVSCSLSSSVRHIWVSCCMRYTNLMESRIAIGAMILPE